jgi:hypothetical protein
MAPLPSYAAVMHLRSTLSAGVLLGVVLGLFLGAAEASAQCRIDDAEAYLPSVSVTVPGASFALGLAGVPVQIRPDAATPNARIEVLSPLRFTASRPSQELSYRIKRSVDLYGGRIRLGPGAVPTWLGNMLRLSVKQPLRVPCSHLDLDDGETPYATPELVALPDRQRVGTGDAFVPVYLFPNRVDAIDVQYSGPFEIEGRIPGWVLLNASWADGSRLRGWTLERFIKPEAGRVTGAVAGMTHLGGCGRADAPLLFRLALRKGAPIAAAPGGAAWTWVTRTLEVEAFPLDRSDGWIRIGAISGLPGPPCAEHEHFWVHARDVIWSRRPGSSGSHHSTVSVNVP